MSLIIPSSSVNLYAGIPISNGFQIVFKSPTEQATYFATKKVSGKADCSYIKKTGRLRLEYRASVVATCDYISFKNDAFENVTFYAEIMDFEYVNNETTDILYSIDWFQTYMFNVRYHACSIIREHLTETQYANAVSTPWRRDIPELMTEEDLPVGEPLETIYTTGSQSINSNRFKLLPSTPESKRDVKYIVFMISQFEFSLWAEADATEFVNLWGYYGVNQAVKPTTLSGMFSSYKDGFVRATALVGLSLEADQTTLNNMNRAIELLTLYGCVGNIVGLYVIPKWALSGLFTLGWDGTSGFEGYITMTGYKDASRDPKLNTFPFKYLRIKTAKDVKEYRLDLFDSLSDPSDSSEIISYEIVSNFNGVPTLSFVPRGYKFTNYDWNYYERLDYSDFPQISYSTDAYYTFLNQQYSAVMANNTETGMEQLKLNKSIADTASKWGGAMAGTGWLGTVASTVNPLSSGFLGNATASNPIYAFDNYSNTRGQLDLNQKLAEQALDVKGEAISTRGSGYSAVYGGTKSAFVSDNYHAGSTGGYLPYQFDALDFVAEIVTLADDVLNKYDAYFKCNGYKSLRNAVPHVCNYINNGVEIPHFETFDGDTFTYVKTENMHVTGAIQVACNSIENLFNSGCRFLKVI